MARRGLTLALAVAWAAPGDCQFLRGHSSVSSWSSTWVWTRSTDGQRHQQTQEVNSQTVQTNEGTQRTEKRMVCKDGLCKEEVMTVTPYGAFGMPPRPVMGAERSMLRSMLEGLLVRGAPVAVGQAIGGPPPLPVATMPQPPSSPHAAAGEDSLDTPFLRGFFSHFKNPEQVRDAFKTVHEGVPPPNFSIARATSSASAGARKDTLISDVGSAGLGLVASIGLLMGLTAAYRCQQSSVSAREVNLTHPLASAATGPEGSPAPVVVAKTAAAAATEDPQAQAIDAARNYLQDLYSKAESQVDRIATAKYVGSLYERATA
mmetsp:Transcript_71297/g.204592  ORF Transcript_71297/g.204592 Transcript_71297/m.204592 type:complete len:318 (-) Transcript_71297:106-1059(-)|eukprot:CAMPEP_0177216986 /NCGR_PEP_ID=MMETSP0367-20130122/35047_1 /TAXON_ID=447022 ORGANISM="Scrippsiella hangoei-like, Strain SHHI-4" /NCGR_SAMPLE_ID=MMETSP0367 /ASSEMBLY_ACC=CAM_ASM_000362 /LENGTH=317 /DNA_ID=CAMNT_0018666533 /DNA_START=14 /DNA_END=967 /DNA_ORIENTATION=-